MKECLSLTSLGFHKGIKWVAENHFVTKPLTLSEVPGVKGEEEKEKKKGVRNKLTNRIAPHRFGGHLMISFMNILASSICPSGLPG